MKKCGNFRVISPAKARIRFDYRALQQARHLVAKVPTECQWFHTVDRTEEDGWITYFISGMYIPEQQVTAATVDSGPRVMMNLSNEVRDQCGGYNEAYNSVMSRLTCWIHSHVNMSVNPSGTDNTQFKEQIENGRNGGQNGPQIMMIFNKRGDYFTRVYDPVLALMFENVSIEPDQPDIDITYVEEAISNKLITPAYSSNTGASWPKVVTTAKSGSKKKTETADPVTTLIPENVTKASSSSEPILVGSSSVKNTKESISANLLSLIETTNQTSDPSNMTNLLVRATQAEIGSRGLDILDSLLFGTKEKCLRQMPMWIYVDEDEMYDNQETKFEENLAESTISPPELYLEAMQIVQKLTNSRDLNEDMIESAIDAWFASTEYEDIKEIDDQASIGIGIV